MLDELDVSDVGAGPAAVSTASGDATGWLALDVSTDVYLLNSNLALVLAWIAHHHHHGTQK